MNFFLDAIKCKDPGLNTAIAMGKCEIGPIRKMNKFEDTAAYLTPLEPVQLKYPIHHAEESKYQQPYQMKEEALQGSSYATTIMINLILCPSINMMSLFNNANPRRMVGRSRNTTKDIQAIRAMLKKINE